MNNPFIQIYEHNAWGHGSGEGSLPVHTSGYRGFLQTFLRSHCITSVVDMGCGDWQFSKLIDWGTARYSGFDVVPSVIQKNTEQFSGPNVSFKHYSGNPAELPAADLILVKDVLQHLPNAAVFEFLKCCPKYRYALVTNCINPKGPTQHVDIEMGAFRYLDLRLPPFNVPAHEVFSFEKKERRLSDRLRARFFGPTWRKRVLLIDNSR